MSLHLMKERAKVSGTTPREEMIRDGQNLLKEELKHDSSYSPTMFFYDSDNKVDDRLANLRVYGRKNSSLNGNYMNFLTTYDNPVKIGDYIHDTKDDTYWLVYNSFNVNDIHYEGKLIQCNYPLKWQLSNGKIVERWANIVSASKYDTGETGNATIVLSSNNFTVLIGFCEEGYELEGKRVFIDKRNVNPEKVFKMTRGDDVLFDSGNMGSLLSFIADKTEFNKDEDRPDLKLCNYIEIDSGSNTPSEDTTTPPENPDEMTDLRASITFKGSQELKIGGTTKTLTGSFVDSDGNATADIGVWEVITIDELLPYLEYTITDNTLKIKVLDTDLIDSKVRIMFSSADNTISTYLDFDVVSMF